MLLKYAWKSVGTRIVLRKINLMCYFKAQHFNQRYLLAINRQDMQNRTDHYVAIFYNALYLYAVRHNEKLPF